MSFIKKDLVWLTISIISFFLLSVSFLLMPLGNRYLQIISGVMFWLFMILGIVSQVMLTIIFRRSCFKNKDWRVQKQRVGIFSIGKNVFAIVADSVLLISAVVFTALMVFTRGTGYISYVMLTLLVFAFCMHCILNGKVYSYICEQNKKDKGRVEKKNDK